MARGGKRAGAGRKPGSANKRTREIADKAAAEGLMPLEYMLGVMRDPGADRERRDRAAAQAAPYCHPRLSAVEHTGKDGGPIKTEDSTPLELARRVGFLLASVASGK